jgi:NADH dehydrogenase (ubiquinone) flavoprotein 1
MSFADLPRHKIRSRSFATVADPPVRRYGGLKDQDRIFTNAYCRHDHGLKGAQVLQKLSKHLPLQLTFCFTC